MVPNHPQNTLLSAKTPRPRPISAAAGPPGRSIGAMTTSVARLPLALPPAAPTPAVTLSPSRAADFKSCPQLYKYRAIDKLPEPADPYRARGTVVHDVLERLYRLPPEERRLEVAQALLDEVWAACRQEEEFAGLSMSEEVEQGWLGAA